MQRSPAFCGGIFLSVFNHVLRLRRGSRGSRAWESDSTALASPSFRDWSSEQHCDEGTMETGCVPCLRSKLAGLTPFLSWQ